MQELRQIIGHQTFESKIILERNAAAIYEVYEKQWYQGSCPMPERMP